ncbi:hypothetical protein GPECTOR_2g984 [Gonium pectorale]|uniref:Uncharacterized protein n=1 Tax=Gonium pectorale TaxID=33097 RepID=A0A150H2B3_GONPE|nr:hypothetical protein GPECTOR_2g984 [Gonium pectorale]|eukprot:KXZ56102.1 hypothetical protein GPECTOR_2g984 [Gonium pectorale]
MKDLGVMDLVDWNGTGGTQKRRNISWPDEFGQSLTHVLEFEPSEHADSDYDDLEERGCCSIM